MAEHTTSDQAWRAIEQVSQLPQGERFGPFVLLDVLGHGGMAEVFRAERRLIEGRATKPMALKRIHPHLTDDPHFVDALLDEAELTMQLNHRGWRLSVVSWAEAYPWRTCSHGGKFGL